MCWTLLLGISSSNEARDQVSGKVESSFVMSAPGILTDFPEGHAHLMSCVGIMAEQVKRPEWGPPREATSAQSTLCAQCSIVHTHTQPWLACHIPHFYRSGLRGTQFPYGSSQHFSLPSKSPVKQNMLNHVPLGSALQQFWLLRPSSTAMKIEWKV